MKLRRDQRRQDERQAWESAAASAPPFSPSDLTGVVTAWLRLAASSQSGGEWTGWTDILNTNPGVINSARRPTVGAAANGLPLAAFLTNDCVAWVMAASNYNRNTWGIFLDVQPTATGSTQVLWSVSNGTGGASNRAIVTYFNGTNWVVDCYITGADGRSFTFPSGAAAGVNRRYGIEYDSSVTGDGCLTATIGGVIQTPVASNIGVGGSLGQLQSITGNILIGNFNDGAASSAMTGNLGPNLLALTGKMAGASSGLLTTAARAQIIGYEVPT